MPQSLRYCTRFVAKKLFPTPPLPLMMRLICLFIRSCVESEVVRICDARTANARASRWRFGCCCGCRAMTPTWLAASRGRGVAVHLGEKTRDSVGADRHIDSGEQFANKPQ